MGPMHRALRQQLEKPRCAVAVVSFKRHPSTSVITRTSKSLCVPILGTCAKIEGAFSAWMVRGGGRIPPSIRWWQTKASWQAVSRPIAAGGGDRRAAFTGLATRPYSATRSKEGAPVGGLPTSASRQFCSPRGKAEVGNASNSSARNVHQKRAPAHHSSLNTKQDCLKIVDTFRDVEGIIPLAAGCLLLAYIEGVPAARTFAAKHGYTLDPRQELLGIGAANFAAAMGHGYPVAGGLSQSAVNDKAGARTALALVFASVTLALCLLFLTGFLENLPKAVLAAVVLTAVYGLLDFPALFRMFRVSRLDFSAAALALVGVLLLGILQGILLAALASILLMLARVSRPHIAFLGHVPGTNSYSDLDRHPENEPLSGVIAFRPEASLIYVNADTVLDFGLGSPTRGWPCGRPSGRLRSFRRAIY